MWAVVTGATKGIGLAIAEKMAENGVNLIVCSRNIRDLEDMKTGFAQKFKDVALVTCRADLSKNRIYKPLPILLENIVTVPTYLSIMQEPSLPVP